MVKQVCRIIDALFSVSLETFVDRRNLAILFSTCITLVDEHRNWLNWFHFFILAGGHFVILIGCMTFLSALLISFPICMSSLSSSFSCNSISCSGCSTLFGRLKKRFQQLSLVSVML